MGGSLDNDESSVSTTPRKRHGARNQHKIKHFVRWLRQTFPDALTDGIVVDVAGGKGELAARFVMCEPQKKVILIDPRPADPIQVYEKFVLPKLPNRWRAKVQAQKNLQPTFVNDCFRQRFQQINEEFDVERQNDVLQACTILIGLHADGATEAIVDAALRLNKPFVVVPCCVFPNFFPSRCLSIETGEAIPVRTHEQFCQYLLQKDQRFRRDELPFEGRNVAIYWNGN